MDRDRDRDRGGSSSSSASGSRQLKRTKLSSTSSESASGSGRQHASASSSHGTSSGRDRESKDREPKLSSEHKPSASSSSASTHEEEKEKVPSKAEIYEAITAYELEEAKNLDHDKALETYLSLLADLEENAVEMLATKYGAENTDPSQKESLRTQAMTSLVTLKNLNRLLKIKLKIAKDDQQEFRQQVDNEHLILQNLLYEATHLQNQVAAVQDYKGMDEKIDLINVDQFYKEAPPKVSKPEVTKEDPHLLRIARLEYEFIQRQKLTEECGALEKEKEAIGKDIEEKQQKLDSVRPLLNKVLESTLPLQEFFDLDISVRKMRHETAKYLPSPLYVLFIQSEAYQEHTSGKQNFIINIGGDVEAAKEMGKAEEKEEEESDSEEKNGDADPDITDRRLKRKRSSFGFTLDEGRKRTLQKHPLWIEWIVTSKAGETIAIQFYYLVKLRIVTVKSKIRRDAADGTVSTSIIGSDNVLNELFPNDSGLESPNPSNTYLFRKFGITSIREHLKETGKPYLWAQRVCGLDFSKAMEDSEEVIKASMDISCESIDDIFKHIRKRLTNQGKLWTQLKSLESRNIQIPPAAKELLPLNNSTLFTSWETMDFEEYCGCTSTKPLVDAGAVCVKDMFFKAVLQRGRAKLIALISIKTDFPAVAPIFCVQLDVDGELRDAITDASIRQMEQEVNFYIPKEFTEWADNIVGIQLHRLMTCCDIELETDALLGDSAGPSEFSRGKLIISPTKGRNLRRPFQFVGQGGGHYTQRY